MGGGALDVSRPTADVKTGSIGCEVVNQIDGSRMSRTGWESAMAVALVAFRAVWQYTPWWLSVTGV